MNASRIAYLYALVDPTDGRVRYVGQTSNLKERLSQHLSVNDPVSTPKQKWLALIAMKGNRPIMMPFKIVPYEHRLQHESAAIRTAITAGADLLNVLPEKRDVRNYSRVDPVESLSLTFRRPMYHLVLAHIPTTRQLIALKRYGVHLKQYNRG